MFFQNFPKLLSMHWPFSFHLFYRIYNKSSCKNGFKFISTLRIADIDEKQHRGSKYIFEGWVKGVRKLKDNVFVDLSDGSTSQTLQIVLNKNKCPNNLSYGSSIVAEGFLSMNPSNKMELSESDVIVIGDCDLKEYPYLPRKSYSSDYVRQFLHLRPRTNTFSSLLRIRSATCSYIHEFFNQNNFFYIHTPILTSNDCEGAGEVFSVIPDNEYFHEESVTHNLSREECFFGNKTYLTVSGQFHLEVVTRSLGKVYNFGPVFRAENSKSRLHLAEFYMVEAETSFTSSLSSVILLSENLLKYIMKSVLDKFSEEIHRYRQLSLMSGSDSICPTNLDKMCAESFNVITYTEASDILKNNSKTLKTPFNTGQSLSKEHELFLVKYNDNKPLFVINWPKKLKPFYMKSLPGNEEVAGFDLLCPNVGELCGGSLREDNYKILESVLLEEKLEQSLAWYLELRKFGNTPTGGFGLGFDRLIQVIMGTSNIKDVIPFPRYPHNCKL